MPSSVSVSVTVTVSVPSHVAPTLPGWVAVKLVELLDAVLSGYYANRLLLPTPATPSFANQISHTVLYLPPEANLKASNISCEKNLY